MIVLGVLRSAYPRQELTKETLSLYGQVLLAADFETAISAARKIIVTLKWFPSLSELVSAIDPSPTPAEGWSEVLDRLHRFGEPGWEFLSPFVHEVVAAHGGWGRLCQMQNAVSERARFIELYQEIRNKKLAKRFALAPAASRPRLVGEKS